MALSNKFGWLVLTTGNKSEMSVGYTTLYGDLAGGFAVIKDVPEDARLPPLRLAQLRRPATRAGAASPRRARSPIPASIIERAPSAELRPDQRDEDSLPPYELLDRILEGYVELDQSREQLIAQGLAAGGRRAHDPPGRPRRVQAPPGASGDQDHPARVRARPAHADHQPLPRLARRRASARYPARVRPQRPAARRAVRARARPPCGNTLQDLADPAQLARGPDRRAVSRVLAGRAASNGLAVTEATHDPSGAYSLAVRRLPRRAARAPACRRCGWSPRPTTASCPAAPTPSRRRAISGVPGAARAGRQRRS